MHIGLIGGIGPAATDYYYRGLIRSMAARGLALDLTIAHADAATLLAHLRAADKLAQAELFNRLSRRLQAAGATLIAVTSIAGHFCIEELKSLATIPICNLIAEVQHGLALRGLQRVGLIGTDKVMDSHFYSGLGALEVVVPLADSRELVHNNYVDMAVSGKVTQAQRDIFFRVGRNLCDQLGAEAVLLGGTDLFLAFDGQECGFPVIDCAALHIDALTKAAASTEVNHGAI